MNPIEASAALTYLTQIDNRVKHTDQLAELWAKRLTTWTAAQTKWAIDQYYSSPVYQPTTGQQAPLVLGTLVGIIQAKDSGHEAKTNAVAAIERARAERKELESKAGRTMGSWRDRNPEEWDRLVAKGRDDRRADLQRRGIELMDWQTDGDRADTGLPRDVQFQGWDAA